MAVWASGLEFDECCVEKTDNGVRIVVDDPEVDQDTTSASMLQTRNGSPSNIPRRYGTHCSFLAMGFESETAALGAILAARTELPARLSMMYPAAGPTFRPMSRRSPAPSNGERKEHYAAALMLLRANFVWKPKQEHQEPVSWGMVAGTACLFCFLSFACLAMHCRAPSKGFPL